MYMYMCVTYMYSAKVWSNKGTKGPRERGNMWLWHLNKRAMPIRRMRKKTPFILKAVEIT